MLLNENNFKIVAHEQLFSLHILLPDNTGNFLHTEPKTLDDCIISHDLLLDTEFYNDAITIIPDEKYFRIKLIIQDVNKTYYIFHSRKLNLIDVMLERSQLIKTD